MRVYARSTTIEEIDDALAHSFVDENHRSGAVKSNLNAVHLGMFFQEELVAVIQFCSPRTPKMKAMYSTEILRLCFEKDVRVVGGTSKLIKFFRDNYHPTDFFTYQDTTGEDNAGYEKAGMSLVSQSKKKEYLVAPNKTIETGTRKEVLGMAYATRYGPDRILGTKLGEVIDEKTGTRKSNKQLFLDLGWHIEQTTGDKVWEWFNPDVTFYVYKITASDSHKYYYGVSHVKRADATIDDCLNDGYWGSGGTKFKNWKNKHLPCLNKEVLFTTNKRSVAYKYEEELVGDLFKTDKYCLNSQKGGISLDRVNRNTSHYISVKECERHGLVKHIGDSCYSCLKMKILSEKYCSEHGETAFFGDSCAKCVAQRSNIIQDCPVHGSTRHIADRCRVCVSEKSFSVQMCEIHQKETTHKGDSCCLCTAQRSVATKYCDVHKKKTTFKGNLCTLCLYETNSSEKFCEIHQEVTRHMGNSCYRCSSEKTERLGVCEYHGEQSFQGDSCRACEVEKRDSVKQCEAGIHGLTAHRGQTCVKCYIQSKRESVKECEKHGLVPHSGNSCYKCESENRVSIKMCSQHGETKFLGNKCYKCSALAQQTIKVCDFHGETKFRGAHCCKCMSNRTWHIKKHSDAANDDCYLCKK